VREGKLRALMAMAPTRPAALPDVPTLAEAGFTGFDTTVWFGLMAPSGTPQPIIDKLYREPARVLVRTDARKHLQDLGMDAVANPPSEFAAIIKSEILQGANLIKEAEISVNEWVSPAAPRCVRAASGCAVRPRRRGDRDPCTAFDIPHLQTTVPIHVLYRKNGYLTGASRTLLSLISAAPIRPTPRSHVRFAPKSGQIAGAPKCPLVPKADSCTAATTHAACLSDHLIGGREKSGRGCKARIYSSDNILTVHYSHAVDALFSFNRKSARQAARTDHALLSRRPSR